MVPVVLILREDGNGNGDEDAWVISGLAEEEEVEDGLGVTVAVAAVESVAVTVGLSCKEDNDGVW